MRMMTPRHPRDGPPTEAEMFAAALALDLPIHIVRRVVFLRWLRATGRLSEWIDPPPDPART